MRLGSRRLFDRSFTGLSVLSIVLITLSLAVLLAPIVTGGLGAFVFRATVEHRRLMLEQFGHGDQAAVAADVALATAARQHVYDLLAQFEQELKTLSFAQRRKYTGPLRELRDRLHTLLGPFPGTRQPVLLREQYGQPRWDRAQVKLHDVLYIEQYDYSDHTQMGQQAYIPRADDFKNTALEALFPYLEANLTQMLRPRWTVYWRFLCDESADAHIFGGILPEVLGTLYLTVGAILCAVPMGIVSAIYLVEYARAGWLVGLLRTCISTLAGVPSIVFGLFGLAFFINTVHVSASKSVLAGSLTLALLILPVVIRASEEALRAVPQTYKEAALSLGSSRWRTIVRVILPAALPGILTGVVISMGRAAGETAPIIFTAAVSVGRPLQVWQTVSQPTPALPWNIYNLCTEHEAMDEIRHVQYGMVLTLVLLVLVLNGAAIIMRARISRKLTG
ncbi:MAG: phosphate ABC transporter permease PstA [Planctomycetes bacterium]|nr:phosphate ABC transporter permease PstA [Planctomycetota bacterium]